MLSYPLRYVVCILRFRCTLTSVQCSRFCQTSARRGLSLARCWDEKHRADRGTAVPLRQGEYKGMWARVHKVRGSARMTERLARHRWLGIRSPVCGACVFGAACLPRLGEVNHVVKSVQTEKLYADPILTKIRGRSSEPIISAHKGYSGRWPFIPQ